jgi:hypothetical protein
MRPRATNVVWCCVTRYDRWEPVIVIVAAAILWFARC